MSGLFGPGAGQAPVNGMLAQGAYLSAQQIVALPVDVITVSTATTAVAGRSYVFTASAELTLPAFPAVGSKITFVNMSGTETASINPGFNNRIRGVLGTMILDSTTAAAEMTYSGSAQGWV